MNSRVRTILGLGLVALSTSSSLSAFAQPEPPEAPKPEEPPPPREMTPEEKAALKDEIKAELIAELERKRAEEEARAAEKARAEAEARAAEEAAAKKAAEEKAQAEQAAAAKAAAEQENPLVPEGQAKDLDKHPVNNDKSTYKPGTGLHFESEDGEFAVGMRLRAQLLQEIEWGPDDAGGTELSQVFQIRRARLQFKGHMWGKHNKYKVEFAFSPRDLSVKDGIPQNTPLLSWYYELDYLRDLTVRMGQYKIPYSRQRVISSGDLQLVDRSLANGEFNHDRDIGFDLRSKDVAGLGGYLRYYAGVYMGEGRDFGDRNATPDFKLHYLGRIEVQPLGEFDDDYTEADIVRHKSPKLSLGGAYSFHHDAQRLAGVLGSKAEDGGTTNYHSFNVDYMFKFQGFSSTGELHWRKGKRKPGGATTEDPDDPTATVLLPVTAPRNGYGFHVQAGYLIPRTRFELAARYDHVAGIGTEDPGDLTDAKGYTSLGQKDSVGGGLSYYFADHSWKLQGDYFYLWNDAELGEGDNRVRLQLQLAL